MSDTPLIPAPITPKPQDCMYEGVQWKYMTHTLPDRKRPLREDASVVFRDFFLRMHNLWRRKTQKIGNAKHIEPINGDSCVRVHFQLHGQPAYKVEFESVRIFRGMGVADEIVETLIATAGGIDGVMSQASKILAALTASEDESGSEVTVEMQPPKKRAQRVKKKP